MTHVAPQPLTVADICAAMEAAYPPHLAESWDKVGLAVGDPQAEVTRVAFALDPTGSVVEEAAARGCQMLITHHPLLLRGVNYLPVTDGKGKLVTALIRNGIAQFAAHTNADSARPGVNDALLEALEIIPGVALEPIPGTVTADNPGGLGIGRIGELATPLPFAEFVHYVANHLPATSWGVRGAGDPDRLITTVAVASGSGGSFLEAADRLGADVLVTSDLKHHIVDDHLANSSMCVVDTAHWASESPWVRQAADVVAAATGVETIVIDICTDPFNLAARAV